MTQLPVSVRIAGGALLIAGLAGVANAEDPLVVLGAMYPGVRSHNAGQHERYVFGAQMTPGLTESQAAAAFLSQHGRIFRSGEAADLETRREWAMPSPDGRFMAFAYRQRIRGKEVDGSSIRVKVRRGAVARVDYAGGRVAGEPTVGSETPLVPASVAAALVQVQQGYGPLTVIGQPEVVVLRGDGTRGDAWCWRVRARPSGAERALVRTFYVDTALPRVIHVRNNFWNFDAPATTGTVEARGMPVAYPWLPYRGSSAPLVLHRIPGLRVAGIVNDTFTGQTGQAFTNGAGEFSLALGQLGQTLTLNATVGQANQWYQVFDLSAPVQYISTTAVVAVGNGAALELGNANMSEEYRVGQADTVVTANRGRDFFTRYMTSAAPGLSYPLFIYPNEDTHTFFSNCNAVAIALPNAWVMAFSPSNVSAGCWNFGTHSAAAHEYGHIALAMLDDAFGAYPAFHEGFADTFGNMLNDDSVQGREHLMDGGSVRGDPTSAGINCQYPLSGNSSSPCFCGEPHKAGQLLSGPWVRIRNGFKSYYGDTAGLEAARKIFGAWSLITLGGGDDICGSAHPGTVIEVLSTTDSLAETGIICGAFAAHGMPCAN